MRRPRELHPELRIRLRRAEKNPQTRREGKPETANEDAAMKTMTIKEPETRQQLRDSHKCVGVFPDHVSAEAAIKQLQKAARRSWA